MTRQRWFCCLCGAMTARMPRPDGRVLCHSHSTVALDENPRSELESLPVLRDTLTRYTCQACGGSGLTYPRNECARCSGLGFTSAPKREATSPASGTES